MSRRHDPRLARPFLDYSALEIAALFEVNLGTVRRWTKIGMRPIAGTRPFLWAGSEVRRFVATRNKIRQPCRPGEIYCVACRRPVEPTGSVVDLLPRTTSSADLVGTCPISNHRIYRRVSIAQLEQSGGGLKVRFQDVKVPYSGNGEPPRTRVLGEVQA